MKSRKEIAAEKKASFKFNCAQAVLTTYSDLTGLDETAAMNIADGFAAGMTTMESTCGALIGADVVLGLVNKDKSKTMKQMREIMKKFEERNHAAQCKQPKGVDTHVVLRPCPLCVADACEFQEEALDIESLDMK